MKIIEICNRHFLNVCFVWLSTIAGMEGLGSWSSRVFHLNCFCSIVRKKSMLNPWIFRKSWELTFWYFSALILYVHSPMCECNACDNVSLEVFAPIKLHSLISHFYKMKDSHNWPHLSLVCGVARELCPIKVVFPEFTVEETRS